MQVKDIMTRDPVRIAPEETVSVAARMLGRGNIGALPVCTADGRLRGIEGQIAQQAVFNQKTVDDVALMNERLCCEAKERKCADNTIVNYVNATFYPKLVADVTTGTTTTAQVIYNPLPSCGCNCG